MPVNKLEILPENRTVSSWSDCTRPQALRRCVTETDTIFGQGSMLEPSTSHIGQGVALHAQAAVLVYINVRHPQIAE